MTEILYVLLGLVLGGLTTAWALALAVVIRSSKADR